MILMEYIPVRDPEGLALKSLLCPWLTAGMPEAVDSNQESLHLFPKVAPALDIS